MSPLIFHRIQSQNKAYPDSLIIRDEEDHQCYILDPSLNVQAIMSYLDQFSTIQSYELWMSTKKVESAPYINALAQNLNAQIYAPFKFITAYRMFTQQSKALGLCGVYTPKIKSDLMQHLKEWDKNAVELYPLSQSYLFYFKQVDLFWYHPQFLSKQDKFFISKINNNVR